MTSYTTNVPAPVLGTNGYIIPNEQAILAGVQEDWNSAFGGNLNPALNTPQGQLATSETAIVYDADSQFLNITNQVDPAYAQGRMQDALGRIYFMTRIPASATTTTCLCNGASGTTITLGAYAQDQSGNIYNANQSGVIPVPAQLNGTISGTTLTVNSLTSGTIYAGQLLTGVGVTAGTIIESGSGTSWVVNNSQSVGPVAMTTSGIALSFQCSVTGQIACPAGFLSTIYQAIPGWDSVYNYVAGALGANVESRADFENRRIASVAINARSVYDAVEAAVLAVPNVLDAYVFGNPLGVESGATFTGAIATNGTLTASSAVTGTIEVGQTVLGTSVPQGTYITALGSGTGGDGTYATNITLGSPISAESMTSAQGGVQLLPHSIYVGVYGGSSSAVAQAIWSKLTPGCDMNGDTNGNSNGVTVSVQDTTPPYASPYPTYAITFTTLIATAINFSVQMLSNANIPSDAVAQVQNAIIATFTGSNGAAPARAGQQILHSNYYAAIFALGSWVQIVEIEVGVGTANQASVLMRIDQEPTIQASNINVTFS